MPSASVETWAWARYGEPSRHAWDIKLTGWFWTFSFYLRTAKRQLRTGIWTGVGGSRPPARMGSEAARCRVEVVRRRLQRSRTVTIGTQQHGDQLAAGLPQSNHRRYRPVSEFQAFCRSMVPMNSSNASGMKPSCSSSSWVD
jgi:hypothetical protein